MKDKIMKIFKLRVKNERLDGQKSETKFGKIGCRGSREKVEEK